MSNCFIDSGLIYGFKPGGSCQDCCFMIGEDNICTLPSSLPFPCTGSYSILGEVSNYDDHRSPIYLTDDQITTVIDALDFFRDSVQDGELYERCTSCLTVFENI